MIGSDYLLLLSVAWIAVSAWLVYFLSNSRQGSTGLPLAYVLIMTLTYGGAWVYLMPGYHHERNAYLAHLGFTSAMVVDGFELALIGLVALVVGILIAEKTHRPALVRNCHYDARGLVQIILIVSGTAFLMSSVLSRIPSIASVLNSAKSVTLCGICLGLWNAQVLNDRRQRLFFLALSLVVPAIYLVFFGFVSYGALALLIVLSFLLCQGRKLNARRFARAAVVASLITYLGLSVYIAYMQFRKEIRAAVWGGKTVQERLAVVLDAGSAIGPFDPWNEEHLHLVNWRLNQCALVGQTIHFLKVYPDRFENGSTITRAVFAWVPRVVWPNKPATGGSALVSKFTGNHYSDGTTVGSGPIFEFYINFGTYGVFVGMLCLGYLVRVLDLRCIRSLESGNLTMFTTLHLVGIQLVNPMTTVFFMVSSVVSAVVLGYLISVVAPPGQRRTSSRFAGTFTTSPACRESVSSIRAGSLNSIAQSCQKR